MIIVPALLWTVPRYGAVGAAWVWVSLNAGYFLIAVNLMYRRIMTAEKWRWYSQDLLVPLGVSVLTVGLFKYLWPTQDTLYSQITVPTIAAITSLAASSLVSHHVRQLVLSVAKPMVSKFI